MSNNNNEEDTNDNNTALLIGETLVNYWVSVVNNEQFLWSILNQSKTIKRLVLVSKSISQNVKVIIENNFGFLQTRKGVINTEFRFYRPKKLRRVRLVDFSQYPSLSSVTHISFEGNFNKSVDDLLPTSVTHLTFRTDFNKLIDKLPHNLTHLKLSVYFNQPVDNLPPNLTNLFFGFHFNQPIDNLPPKITKLTLDWCFNHDLNHLPPNITHLTISSKFNKSIFSPPSLKFITRI